MGVGEPVVVAVDVGVDTTVALAVVLTTVLLHMIPDPEPV